MGMEKRGKVRWRDRGEACRGIAPETLSALVQSHASAPNLDFQKAQLSRQTGGTFLFLESSTRNKGGPWLLPSYPSFSLTATSTLELGSSCAHENPMSDTMGTFLGGLVTVISFFSFFGETMLYEGY